MGYVIVMTNTQASLDLMSGFAVIPELIKTTSDCLIYWWQGSADADVVSVQKSSENVSSIYALASTRD